MLRVTILALLASLAADARVVDRSSSIAGATLHYKVVLPNDYDPAKSYPAILAFPPGAQTMDMVMGTLQRNWAPEALRRGYIVVIPAAPLEGLFTQGGSRVFPDFLDQLLGDYKIRDNKFHIAGMSNGGLSAFHIAASWPRYFLSVTGFPGYLPDATAGRIGALAGMCIHMYVGELDTGWLEAMKKQSLEFRARGMTVEFTVEKGQGHVMSTLTGDGSGRLFDGIEAARNGCGKP